MAEMKSDNAFQTPEKKAPGSVAPLPHGTTEQLLVREKISGEPTSVGGNAKPTPERQHSGGSYSPRHNFVEDTYQMTLGSETPAHHGTVEKLHLHEPVGSEPPIPELPGLKPHGHGTHSDPAAAAAAEAGHALPGSPGSRQPRHHHDFHKDIYKMTRGSEAPEHHGTVQKLHLHDPVGTEPVIAELPGVHFHHGDAAGDSGDGQPAPAVSPGGDTKPKVERQHSGGSYSPRHSFIEDTYQMTRGSETPAHHGTVEKLHLHEPVGMEPPIPELPGLKEHHGDAERPKNVTGCKGPAAVTFEGDFTKKVRFSDIEAPAHHHHHPHHQQYYQHPHYQEQAQQKQKSEEQAEGVVSAADAAAEASARQWPAEAATERTVE